MNKIFLLFCFLFHAGISLAQFNDGTAAIYQVIQSNKIVGYYLPNVSDVSSTQCKFKEYWFVNSQFQKLGSLGGKSTQFQLVPNLTSVSRLDHFVQLARNLSRLDGGRGKLLQTNLNIVDTGSCPE